MGTGGSQGNQRGDIRASHVRRGSGLESAVDGAHTGSAGKDIRTGKAHTWAASGNTWGEVRMGEVRTDIENMGSGSCRSLGTDGHTGYNVQTCHRTGVRADCSRMRKDRYPGDFPMDSDRPRSSR